MIVFEILKTMAKIIDWGVTNLSHFIIISILIDQHKILSYTFLFLKPIFMSNCIWVSLP